MRLMEALNKTFVFFEEQIAWLNALSLDAVRDNGKVLGYINLLDRRFVAELWHRLSRLGKLPRLFVNATDPAVVNSILQSCRSLPRGSQHRVTVSNSKLLEIVSQRIATQFDGRSRSSAACAFHRRVAKGGTTQRGS